MASSSSSCALPACTRQRYVENGVAHAFCGRTHAAAAGKLRAGTVRPTCALPGCERPVAVGDAGVLFDFCGRQHASAGVQRRKRTAPTEVMVTGASGWKLKLLKTNDDDYKSVAHQFISKWQDYRGPTLVHIWKVENTPAVFVQYQELLEELKGKLPRNGDGLNVRRRFHGTTNACGVGLDIDSQPCNSASCCICGILESGFRASGGGSYGSGVYSSSAPAKADGYVRGGVSPNGRPLRCMFLVLAAAGVVAPTPGASHDASGFACDLYVLHADGSDELV